MANYAASVLAKGQAVVTAKYQTPEQRRQLPSVMGLALKNQSISIPNAQALRESPLRTVDVNYLTNIAAGSGTAKVAVHTGTYGDSGAINVVYVQTEEPFSLPLKISANSVYEQQELFNNRYEMAWKNLRTRQDNLALAFLIANSCQLSNVTMTPLLAAANAGYWNGANFALEIDQTNKSLFIQYIKSAMAARFYSGPYDIVTDLQLARGFEYQMNQGSGNFANTDFQFGDAGIVTTQVLVSSLYPGGAALIMPQGALAGLNWNEQLNKTGFDAGDTTTGKLGTVADPLGSGAVADVSYYVARADTSANTSGGSTQDMVPQWELTVTIGYVLPPLSLAGDSVVMLTGQMT
jgi:hypothetical protein